VNPGAVLAHGPMDQTQEQSKAAIFRSFIGLWLVCQNGPLVLFSPVAPPPTINVLDTTRVARRLIGPVFLLVAPPVLEASYLFRNPEHTSPCAAERLHTMDQQGQRRS
jgi:hypothetical protein